MSKRVVYFEDGIAKKIFNSIKEASLATGIDEGNIFLCVRGYKKDWDGKGFQYEITAKEAREIYWKNKRKK